MAFLQASQNSASQVHSRVLQAPPTKFSLVQPHLPFFSSGEFMQKHHSSNFRSFGSSLPIAGQYDHITYLPHPTVLKKTYLNSSNYILVWAQLGQNMSGFKLQAMRVITRM